MCIIIYFLLTAILGLIEWAVGARYNQRVRAHLYGALLNYLQMQPDFYGK